MYKVNDFQYFTSALGNAYYSGVPFLPIIVATNVARNAEEFDIAVEASVMIQDIINDQSEKRRC